MENDTAPFDLTNLPTGKAMVRAASINAAATAAPLLVVAGFCAIIVGVDAVKTRFFTKKTPATEE